MISSHPIPPYRYNIFILMGTPTDATFPGWSARTSQYMHRDTEPPTPNLQH
jgi:hypothetical protein